MQVTRIHFKRHARAALANERLQTALGRLQQRFVDERARALADLDDVPALRAHATAIRDQVLTRLDEYLERFERAARAAGTEVHWAEDAAAVNRILLEIAARYGVRRVVKSKSMVSEECAINDALAAHGIHVIETDLGEYILQLAHERPSHIVAPVVHKSKDQVAELFAHAHGTPAKDAIAELCREAREVLRPAFLNADMGISGANFLVATTGSAVIVTNEGNGRLVTTLPRVHVAITGIEKIVPTLDDLAVLLRLLPRSATGQSITNYVSLLTGARRPGDTDGPESMHIILVDNGRSELVGGEFQPMLRCIRCGACMNHCPVYQNVGGHAYGSVYPGPMGAVLTPLLAGLANARDLPNASTFCGACAAVCPVNIPLPDLLRRLREREVAQRLRPVRERLLLRLWSYSARHPRLYRLIARAGARVLRMFADRDGLIHRLPGGWTAGRDLPAPPGRTFHELYRARHRG